MTIFVTGGAGFIGSNFVIDWLDQHDELIINIDRLTYAGNLNNLSSLEGNGSHVFVKGDIGDSALLKNLLSRYEPRAIVNFAAESHVDRSIHGPEDFMQTNIIGTYRLLECAKEYWQSLSADKQSAFRFLHVSTDEVYGSLPAEAPAFSERIVMSQTVRTVLARHPQIIWCAPTATPMDYQFLQPIVLTTMGLTNFLKNSYRSLFTTHSPKSLCQFMATVCRSVIGCMSVTIAAPFAQYLSEATVVRSTTLVDSTKKRTSRSFTRYATSLMSYVHWVQIARFPVTATSSPTSKTVQAMIVAMPSMHLRLNKELNWRPAETFETGIRKTVQWYLDNADWVEQVISGEYRQWVERQYA